MSEKFDKKAIPVIHQLRQAVNAMERAREATYSPIIAAHLANAADHIKRAGNLAARITV